MKFNFKISLITIYLLFASCAEKPIPNCGKEIINETKLVFTLCDQKLIQYSHLRLKCIEEIESFSTLNKGLTCRAKNFNKNQDLLISEVMFNEIKYKLQNTK